MESPLCDWKAGEAAPFAEKEWVLAAIKRIVVGTDFSDRSDRAIRRAISLASAFSADLILVHVVEGSQPEDLVRAIESLATDELETLSQSIARSHKIKCSAKVLRGEAFDAIVTLARDSVADLVVMGTHRKVRLEDVVVGTTLERVVRAQRLPVLVVNADNPTAYRSVLATVDFSECSKHALETAHSLGLLVGSRVAMLHIFDPSVALERDMLTNDIASDVAAATLKSGQGFNRYLNGLDLHDLEYSVRVRPEEGPPAIGIRAVAAEMAADLVVVGTQGRNRAMKILLGSVTDDLLKTLAMDILVVPCDPLDPDR